MTSIENLFERIADLIAPALRERRLDAERRADTDALTELANRAAFDRAEPTATADPNAAFVFFDANNFGRLNKLRGHAAGDRLLRFYADTLAQIAGEFNARLFRWGGDEFVIICRTTAAERLRDAAERRAVVVLGYEDFTVSLSGEIGGTLAQADARLQARKRIAKSREPVGT